MKRLLFLFFLFMASFQMKAQIAVKFLHFRPTGDQGVAFDKRFTAEIMYMDEFEKLDGNWRLRAGISYVPLKARLDTFPTYAVEHNGSNVTVLPGYEVYKKYNMGFLFGGVDWAFVNREKFAFFMGVDILMGGVNMEYERHYENYKDESFSGGQFMGGVRLRAGGQYMINEHFTGFTEFSRSYYGMAESGFQSHYDYGVGVIYNFN